MQKFKNLAIGRHQQIEYGAAPEMSESIDTFEIYGEYQAHDRFEILAGEDDFCEPNQVVVLSKEDEETQIRVQLCEKYRKLLSERQEMKRKNVFLQKKMVEFFKKRKMDCVLKEDPKGLDIESKYLKRLFEIEEYRSEIADMEQQLSTELRESEKETISMEKETKEAQEAFIEKQRGIAQSLETKKTKKKISIKAIDNFLCQQKANTEELSDLRYQDIKLKRLLQQRQELAKTLDSLGHGLRRADYEMMKFEYEQRCITLQDKLTEAKELQSRVSDKVNSLTQAQVRSKHVNELIYDCTQRLNEVKFQEREAWLRNQKLSKMCRDLRRDQVQLEDPSSAGILLEMPVIRKHEENLAKYNQLLQQLEETKEVRRSRLTCPTFRSNTAEISKLDVEQSSVSTRSEGLDSSSEE